jgi:hypothetical protein
MGVDLGHGLVFVDVQEPVVQDVAGIDGTKLRPATKAKGEFKLVLYSKLNN